MGNVSTMFKPTMNCIFMGIVVVSACRGDYSATVVAAPTNPTIVPVKV